jgi:hypothetical protein
VAPGIFVRDLGLGESNGGEYTVQVVQPEGARVEHLHRHEEGFSLAYGTLPPQRSRPAQGASRRAGSCAKRRLSYFRLDV